MKPKEKFVIPVPQHHPDYNFYLAYSHHIDRVATLKCDVKSWNTISNSFFRIIIGKLKADWERNRLKAKQDLRVLSILNKADLKGGVLKTFQTTPFPEASLRHKLKLIEEMETENSFIGLYIRRAQAEVHSFNPMYYKGNKDSSGFALPKGLRGACPTCDLDINRDCTFLHFFWYPKIYLDISVRDLLNLGRVEIQLYMAAAPALVRDLVKICSEKQVERLKVVKMFLDLWIVFEFSLPKDTDCFTNLDTNKNIIDNLNQAGILSFADDSMSAGSDGPIKFTMSVRPIPLLNEKRVPFGRIISNSVMLEKIQEFGNPKGNPKKRIIITDCGLV